ncbi:carbohydrate ABC transporter permease [Flavimaricola marinus]|uniref:carbohydrate ABC transporter permease n=1 Tax=Flavimaricola marinus TaxID=1819565 RepID=UPI0014557156|nr:sugar ABC transporter permease [Flavimaricola marinus]
MLALLAYPLIVTLGQAFWVDGGLSLAVVRETLSTAGFWQVLSNTVIFTVGSTLISMLLGFSFAYALEFVEGTRRFFASVLIIPLAMMPVVSALTFGMMLDPALGVVNAVADLAAWSGSGWHTETPTALATVMMVDVWQWTPFCFAIIHAGFRSLPADVSEAARIDGATARQELFSISLPMMGSVLLVAFVFRFMEAFKAFDVIYVMTQGGPGRASETLVIRAYKEAFLFFKPETAASIGVLLLVTTLIAARPIGRALTKST